MDEKDIPIANDGEFRCDREINLYRMRLGSAEVYVWAGSFDKAFEELVEWADEHAPGFLVSLDEDDLKQAATELGLPMPSMDAFVGCIEDTAMRILEHAEADLTDIGHTSLKNGQYVRSDDWGGDEIDNGTEEWKQVALRSDPGPYYAYGNGMPGCLFDNASGPYSTVEEAAEDAQNTLEMTDEERDDLIANRIHYFSGPSLDEDASAGCERRHEVGAAYVKIFKVDCTWTWWG